MIIRMTRQQREKLRRSFRPRRIQLLFVGESPPASGRFFYAANSGLYRAMSSAFQMADETINEENFLAAFRARGCYLIDLCHEPVDDLDMKQRRLMRRDGEKSLAREIARLRPDVIAPLLRAITGTVVSAVAQAGWQGQVLPLPYPGRWVRHREQCIAALTPVIRSLANVLD